jgi:hypothetical protein
MDQHIGKRNGARQYRVSHEASPEKVIALAAQVDNSGEIFRGDEDGGHHRQQPKITSDAYFRVVVNDKHIDNSLHQYQQCGYARYPIGNFNVLQV